jgi:hypothetical protein
MFQFLDALGLEVSKEGRRPGRRFGYAGARRRECKLAAMWASQ